MKTFSFLEWLEEGGAKGLRSFALDKSYERISWVYSCINRISTTASSAPLVFYRGDKSDAIRGDDSHNRITDENDPVYHLFHPPNPPDIPSLKELISRTFIHLGVDGLLFWVFVRKKGVLVDIEIKAKNELRPVLSEGMSGELIGWAEFGANGQVEKTYPVNEVLPIRYYNPKDPLGGLSPLLAARLSLESEFNIAGWNSSFFKSGMKSPLLMKSKGTMTKDQKKELKGEIINYYSGIEGGHGALLVQGGVEVEPLSISPKDIDFINGKKLNREEICAIFGIPPALVGIFEYANYCISIDTPVLLKGNVIKPVQEVQPGDVVLTMGTDSITENKVINSWEAGIKDIYRVTTAYRSLESSPEHRFYVKAGPGAEWVQAKDLKVGDQVAVVTETPETHCTTLPNGEEATPELMHQLGLFVGDGNISMRNGYAMGICIGRPETDETRPDYIEEAKQVFKTKRRFRDGRGVNVISDATCYRVCSVAAAELVQELGFAGTSKTKRIPSWVAGLSTNLKREFIRGILETDGYYRGTGRYSLALSNGGLLEDIKGICISVGYNVTNIRYSFKVSNYGPNPMWTMGINTEDEDHGFLRNKGDLPKGLMWDKVRSVELLDPQPTYDLEIEGTHNYFANWMVTHNSNVREQIRIFWELTLLPKLGSILDLIQVNILDTEFPGVYAKWDLSEVHGLKRDPADVADAVKKYRESGLPFKQIAILLNLPQLEPDGSWDLEPVQPTRPPAPQQLPDGDEEDEPQEEALVLMPKTNWLEDYNSRDLAQTDLLCKDVENALEQFGASIYSVYKRGSALRREFWINFWDDLVGKSLRHVFGTSYKDAVWCVARSTNGTKQKLLIAGELKDLVYAEVNGYIQGTKTIPNSLVSFLANNEIAAWSNYLSYQRDMAGILVAGVREQTRYHVFARTGVKKQVWVCRDDLHQHLHNSELNGDGIYPHSSKLLPRDIVGCTCTTMPIEFS